MPPGPPAPRRSPAPGDRQRDAERTRQALLDAARTEFAAKGRAGARVSEIAARAGVNKQLISYYFGGKDGLYDALLERWHAEEEQLTGPGVSLGELAYRYLEVAHRDPELQRLFVRESLEQTTQGIEHDPDAHDITDLLARKAAGEIAEELDPAFVLIVLQSTVCAGAVFPAQMKSLTGLEPTSAEYLEWIGDQLRRLARRLA